MENHCAGGGGAGGLRLSRTVRPMAEQVNIPVLADRPKAAAALQTASAAVLASMTAVCVFRRSSAVLQVAMGLMLGGALANLVERWARGMVTDYVYLPRAVIPFFRRIVWNVADLSVFAGCLVAIGVLLCEAM